jgi:hypothetical protein
MYGARSADRGGSTVGGVHPFYFECSSKNS